MTVKTTRKGTQVQPMTRKQIEKVYTLPSFERVENSRLVKIDISWERKYLAMVDIPELAGIPFYNGRLCDGRLYCHRGVHSPYQAIFKEIKEEGLLGDILEISGMFNPRLTTGSETILSLHGGGLAIDLNAPWNPWGGPSAALGETGTLLRVLPIFMKFGFVWLGEVDPMHIQPGVAIHPPLKVAADPSGKKTKLTEIGRAHV